MAEVETTLVFAMMGMAVLNIFGVMYLWKEQLAPRLYNLRGKIMIKQLMPNDRFKTTWVKPVIEKSGEGVKINEKGEVEGEYGYFFKLGNKTLPLVDKPGAIYMEGSKKMAIYDTEGSQMVVSGLKKLMSPVSAEMLESLGRRTWNAARAMTLFDKKLQTFIMLSALLALGATLGAALVYGEVSQLKEIIIAQGQQITQLVQAGTQTAQTGGLTPA